MRSLYIIFLIFYVAFNVNYIFASEQLYEDPIDLIKNKKGEIESPNEIDIEKYIKEQIKNEYVPISLDECIKIALRNNFNIKLDTHEFLSSKYEYQNSLSKFLPYLNTSSYISEYKGQILVGEVLSDYFKETAISINVTAEHKLTEGGKQIFEAKAKKYFEKSRRHNLNYTKSEVIFKSAKSYLELLLAKINIEIYLRNYIERNAQLKLSQNLKNSGFGTNFDVSRSKSESLQAKVELLRALNNFKIAQSRLCHIMGIELDVALMPFESDVKTMDLFDENKDTSEIFEMAINLREDLKSIKDIINYEKQIRNTYYTEFAPKPLISYQEQWQGTLNTSIRPNYIVSLFLSWNLGENLGFGTITKVKAQKEIIKMKKTEYLIKLREIEQNLIEAQSESKYNKQEYEIAQERLEYALESVRLAVMRFDSGKGILLDVIQAQTEVTQARVEYIKAIVNYNISQLNLCFNTGTINAQDIIKSYYP